MNWKQRLLLFFPVWGLVTVLLSDNPFAYGFKVTWAAIGNALGLCAALDTGDPDVGVLFGAVFGIFTFVALIVVSIVLFCEAYVALETKREEK